VLFIALDEADTEGAIFDDSGTRSGRTRAEIERLLFAIVGYGRFPAEFRALGMSTTRVSNSFFKGALIIG
jgi:hypothetical protein